MSSYLSSEANEESVRQIYNDLNLELHEECLGKLLKAGMDEPLAKYFGQMFVRSGRISRRIKYCLTFAIHLSP